MYAVSTVLESFTDHSVRQFFVLCLKGLNSRMTEASNMSARTVSPLHGIRCAYIPCDLIEVRIKRLAYFMVLLFWNKSPEKVIYKF
jgi:hypothetical protein